MASNGTETPLCAPKAGGRVRRVFGPHYKPWPTTFSQTGDFYMKRIGLALLASALLLTGCGDDTEDAPIVFNQNTGSTIIPQTGSTTQVGQQNPLVRVTTGAGTQAQVQAVVATFNGIAGAAINPPGAVGPATNRRDINWDGVPAGQTQPNNLIGEFFQVNSSRGVLLSAPGGTAVRVADDDFAHINANYGALFNAFSPTKTFAAIGSNQIQVDFRVPGTGNPGTAASTRSFGVVFSDVDLANTTNIALFDAAGNSLGQYFAPPSPGGFSFVGVDFQNDQRIRRAVITLGNSPLGAAINETGAIDLVIADDFIYSEPVAP